MVKITNLVYSDIYKQYDYNNTLNAVCSGMFNGIHTNQVCDRVVNLAVVYIYHRGE